MDDWGGIIVAILAIAVIIFVVYVIVMIADAQPLLIIIGQVVGRRLQCLLAYYKMFKLGGN